MRIHILLFTVVCFLLGTFLSSCHTGHEAVAHKTSHQPKFIDDVYINGHAKSSATANAIDPAKPKPRIADKSKKPSPQQDETDQSEVTVPMEKCAIEPVFKKDTYTAKQEKEVKKKYADMLGIKPKEISSNTLYEFIDAWYGTNYHLGGCSRSGIDCSGFAQKLYGEVYGIELLRTAMEQYHRCKRIKHSKDAEEGDLVFFHIHSKHITHVGIYLANDYFVHASTSGGVMISNLNEDYWHKYFAGAGRIAKS